MKQKQNSKKEKVGYTAGHTGHVYMFINAPFLLLIKVSTSNIRYYIKMHVLCRHTHYTTDFKMTFS